MSRARGRRRPDDGPWTVGAPEYVRDGDEEIVRADVAGTRVVFSTRDVPLSPAPEAFAGPLLLPALRRGARVDVDGALDPAWLEGTRRLADIYAEWWGYPGDYPFDAAVASDPERSPAPGHGLLFTGGVDCFYALVAESSLYDHLVFIQGFDIALSDHVRMDAFDRSLRDVAKATGKQAVVLRSDLREHPLVNLVSWDRTHGGALASSVQLLAPRLGTVSIAASWHGSHLQPWGSHPTTDVLWSSSRVAFRHGEVEHERVERLRRITEDPLAQAHLRVCWENRSPEGNCSVCEKCLRTMTALAGMGRLESFSVFDPTVSLPEALDGLATIGPVRGPLWRELLPLDLPPDLRGAVERLLARSRKPWWRRLFSTR